MGGTVSGSKLVWEWEWEKVFLETEVVKKNCKKKKKVGGKKRKKERITSLSGGRKIEDQWLNEWYDF